jgi:hypothetical protein
MAAIFVMLAGIVELISASNSSCLAAFAASLLGSLFYWRPSFLQISLTSCILLFSSSQFAVLFACFLPHLLFTRHCIHLSGTSWELLRTELAENSYWTQTGTGFIWNSLYNLRTDHTQKTSHAAAIIETCAPIIA